MGEAERTPGATTMGGFTLIEVVVALALLATVMTAVFAVHGGGLRNLARAEEGERAAIIADGLLAQLGTATPVQPNGHLEGRAGDYLWTIEQTPYKETRGLPPPLDALVQVRIAVARPGRLPFELVTLKFPTPPPTPARAVAP